MIESEAVGSLAIGGGFMALLATLELVLAAGVLAVATPLLALLLVVWVAFTGALAAVFCRRRLDWVGRRVGLTHDLIERMVGHRTRIAQQPREQWHDGEDETLERYVHASSRMDRAAVWLLGIVPRGWMVAGLARADAALRRRGRMRAASLASRSPRRDPAGRARPFNG